jgi:sigma-B regulation protein RsbU (phosphoserine phosphatase)
MSEKKLTIIGRATDAHRDLVERTLALWPEGSRPTPMFVPLAQALTEPGVLAQTRVAWLMLDDTTPGFHELVAAMQDLHVAGVLTRADERKAIADPFQLGVLIAPPAAPPAVTMGMIRSLWHQSEVLHALRAELALLQAHQGGLADQIGKIDEELRLAAQLQREFLPSSLPRVGSVDFRVLYRPAGYVSGDIYDVIRLDEHHVGFYLADAVGHGVPAALMTVFIKRSLPSKRMTPGRGYEIIAPNEALAHLNQDLARTELQKVHFATACYGVINTRTLELAFARAGHPFPMLLRGDGRVDWLNPDGGLLGVFPEEQFELMTTQLQPGDRLLIYSDGFEVAFPEWERTDTGGHRLINSNRYTEEFRDLAHGSADEALARLSDKLDRQAGSLNQVDDITALLVAVNPPHDAESDALSFDGVPMMAGLARSSA